MEDSGQHPQQRKKNRHHRHTDCKQGLIFLGVASGLLVKALDCGSKGLEFQSHLQQRFISLPGALSPTPKIE